MAAPKRPPPRMILEAPPNPHRVGFAPHFGPAVTLGNAHPADVIALETLRVGLRADPLKLFHGRDE